MELALDHHRTRARLPSPRHPLSPKLTSRHVDPGAILTHKRGRPGFGPGPTLPVLPLLAALLAMGVPAPTRADDAPAVRGEDVPSSGAPDWSSVALFAGGAASGFLAHESCHAAANFAFGNTPTIESVSFAGFLPFFAVSPGIQCSGATCRERDGTEFGAGRRGLYTIVMAGLQCQHLWDEIILTHDPALRHHDAPFRKGMLAFGTLTSIAYVMSNWAGLEPSAGDLRGTYRDTGAPRNVVNVLVLSAAVLDLSRYFFPEVPWLPWLSRAAKIGVTGITFTL